MLSELCKELKNWFNYNQPRFYGTFTIADGKITDEKFLDRIQNDQYFRIIGSVFNDGVYQYADELVLSDEVFEGVIWLMAIPKEVLDLNKEIDDWVTEYGKAVSTPFSSESFGGYSYSKASGGSSGSSGPTWQSTFASRLNAWRKI